MSKKFYIVTRDLHLYLGLFFAPFVLVFAVSVFFLVHAWIPGATAAASAPRVVSNVSFPAELETLAGRDRLNALQAVLPKLGAAGEIFTVTHKPKEHQLRVLAFAPGRETTVVMDLAARSATITQRETGVWDALVALHKAPGPHLVDVRMNWWPMAVWRWFADGTVYLLFFISISGIYLWAVLRGERRIGLTILGAGVLSFLGILYALIF